MKKKLNKRAAYVVSIVSGVLIFSLNLSNANASPGVTLHYNRDSFLTSLGGLETTSVDFDSIPAGTDITGTTINGVRFDLGNFYCGGHTYRCGVGPNAPLVVINSIPRVEGLGLPATSGDQLLSPGGSTIDTCRDPETENDDVVLTFDTPVQAAGLDVIFKSPDEASYVGVRFLDPDGNILLDESFILSPRGAPGFQFVGLISDSANIGKIEIDEYDDNCANPDEHVGYDSIIFTSVAITATVDIDPDTLNLASKGKWITAYIEFPEGYNVEDIDCSTIRLEDTVPAASCGRPLESVIGDYDEDGISDLMVKFDRLSIQELLEPAEDVELTISGALNDSTPFEGSDTIRVIDKGGKK